MKLDRSIINRRSRRRGSLYVAVLGVSLIVSMIAFSAMHVARLHLKTTETTSDRYEARLLALSGLEYAILELNENDSWRTDYVSNTEYPANPIVAGNGSFTCRYVDLGGGTLRLDGIGRSGSATCVLSVDLASRPSLDAGLLVGGDLNVTANDVLRVNDGPVVVNGTFTNNGSVTADAEALSYSGLGAYNGSRNGLTHTRVLPDSGVFDYYKANGTYINFAFNGVDTLILENTVISPLYKPYGATNPHGIYLVDAGNFNVAVKDCRIIGTLVILNLKPGKVFIINKDVNWEPAYSTFPAFLVDGDVHVRHSDDGVDEWEAGIGNLNPTGAPYQGQTDSNGNDDIYPSAIAGLGYCTGDLTFDGRNANRSPSIQGLWIVAGDCTVDWFCDPTIDYKREFAALPPPGFGDGQLQAATELNAQEPSPASVQQVLYDDWWGQFIQPNLPPTALMWRITKLEVKVRRYGAGSGSLHVVTYEPAADGTPGQEIEDISIARSTLPTSFQWVEAPLSTPGDWTLASQGICVGLEARGTDAPAEIEYANSGVSDGGSGMLRGNGATWTAPLTNKAIAYRFEAEYTTSASFGVTIVPGSLRQTPGP